LKKKKKKKEKSPGDRSSQQRLAGKLRSHEADRKAHHCIAPRPMRALVGCALLAPPVPPLFLCQSAVVAALKRHSERERERERESETGGEGETENLQERESGVVTRGLRVS
jgi:hypothetical protein